MAFESAAVAQVSAPSDSSRGPGGSWNAKTAHIGRLHFAYQYCAATDHVLSVKETSPWERDAKVVDELERALDRGECGAVVVHLLGLDYLQGPRVAHGRGDARVPTHGPEAS